MLRIHVYTNLDLEVEYAWKYISAQTQPADETCCNLMHYNVISPIAGETFHAKIYKSNIAKTLCKDFTKKQHLQEANEIVSLSFSLYT